MNRTLLLVTGSRRWTDPRLPIFWFNLVWAEACVDRSDSEMWLMHGACPDGLDRHAHLWASMARFPGVVEQARPALWEHTPQCDGRRRDGLVCRGESKRCRIGGFRRNLAMVREAAECRDRGWQVKVVGFCRDGSPGTTHCVAAAALAGLDPVVVEWVDPPNGHV